MKKAKRTCVIVAGMHRSGTSALARVLNMLGCELPVSLIGPDPNNDLGYWEPASINTLNNILLESAGSSWDDCTPFTQGWFGSPRSEEFRERCVNAYESEYGDSKLVVLKEPRICRLLPFWLDVIEGQNVEPLVILPIRNPLAVAGSLTKRDSSDPFYNLHLWLRHVLDAEQGSRGKRRFFSGYDSLLDSWSAVISKSEAVLNFKWPRFSAKASEEIDAYISTQHRHHKSSTEEVITDNSIPLWVRQTYEIMIRWIVSGEDKADYTSLDAIRFAFDASCANFARVLYRGKQAQSEVSDLTLRNIQERNSVAELTQRVMQLDASLATAEQFAALLAQERDAQNIQITALQRHLEVSNSEHEQQQTALRDLNVESVVMQTKLSELQADLTLTNQHSQSVSARCAELELDLNSETRDHSELKSVLYALQVAQVQIAEASAAQIADKKDENSTLTNLLNIASEKFAVLESHLAVREAWYAAAEIEFACRERQVGELTASLNEVVDQQFAGSQQFATEVQVQNEKSELLSREIQAGSLNLSAMKSRNEQLESDLQLAQSEHVVNTSLIDGLKAHVSLLTEDLQLAQSQASEEHEAHTVLKGELSALLGERHELKDRLAKLSADLSQSEKQAVIGSATINGLKAHIDLLIGDVEAARVAQDQTEALLLVRNDEMNAAQMAAQANESDLTTRCNQTTQELERQLLAVNVLNASIEQQSKELIRLEADKQYFERKADAAASQLAQAQAELSMLQEADERNQAITSGLKQHVHLLIADVDSSKAALETERTNQAGLWRIIDQVQADLAAAEAREAAVHAQVQELEHAMAQTQSALRQRSAEATDLHQDLEAAQQALKVQQLAHDNAIKDSAHVQAQAGGETIAQLNTLSVALAEREKDLVQREKDLAEAQSAVAALKSTLQRQAREHQSALHDKEAMARAIVTASAQTTDKLRGQVNALVRGLADEKHAYFQLKNTKLQRNSALLKQAGVIDELWYLGVNEDVAKAGIDPALHYLTSGVHEGRAPAASS